MVLNLLRHLKLSRHQLEIDFLAAISHEVRTPLNGIVGTLGLLAQMQLSERQREYLDTLRKSSDQLLQVMNNVLDVVKIDAHQFSLEPMPFDITAATNLALEAYTYECQRKNLTLVVRHQPHMPTYVRGDPARYRQILSAILSNAVGNTSQGHIFLNLSQVASSQPQPTLSYCIEIEDTGCGISPAKLTHIHQQFARQQLSSYHRHPGAGLGLTLMHGLLNLMQGKVEITTTEGKGTTVTLHLTFPAAVKETKPSSPRLPNPHILQGTRALLVNNHALSRRVTHEMLAACGIQVEEAGSGKEAAIKLKSGRSFNLILMDTQLEDLATFIRQVKSTSHSLLVALARTGQRGDDLRYEKEKFGAYLLKPYTFEEFSTVLALALARARDKNLPLPAGIATREQLNRLRLSSNPPQAGQKVNFGNVLVIEDDAVNQKVLNAILNRLGAKPTLAANGKEGMELFAGGGFNLVLMDMNMPLMDGPEAARHMRKMETGREGGATPIVALTASSMPQHRNACLAAGMNDFITKPVTVEKLQAVMEKWVQL